MSNLKDIRPKKHTINADGEDIAVIFDMNSLALLEEEYGGIEEALAVLEEGSIKGLKTLLWAGVSHKYMNYETEKMEITKAKVGSWIPLGKFADMQEVLMDAFMDSMPEAQKEEITEKIEEEASQMMIADEEGE